MILTEQCARNKATWRRKNIASRLLFDFNQHENYAYYLTHTKETEAYLNGEMTYVTHQSSLSILKFYEI